MYHNQRVKNYYLKSEINIIPLLDILLVLLVVFIMIPSTLIKGFEITLPNSDIHTHTIHDKKNYAIIEILDKNSYNFTINNKCIKRINKNQLLLEICSRTNVIPDLKYLIAASKNTEYSEIIYILNLLSNAGITSIGMVTNPVSQNIY